MGLEITNQTNEQECGVCAITSLHNYYYHDKLEKEQVLDKCNIKDTGMTIFDFESIAQIVGIECETYEIEWPEFVNLRINNYFVVLVSTKEGQSNHYVVVKKHKRKLKIYDSCSYESKELSYEDFKKIFLNVIILVNKKPNKLFNKVFSKVSTILMFDLKFVLLNLLLSILILGASIASASLLNWIIDESISKSSINNLFTICFIFLFIYFSNNLLNYIANLYVSNQMKTYYMLFTNKILLSIEYKKQDFLTKVDKNWIYKIDECVYSIANFSILEINKLITNIIFSFVCIFVVSSMQVYMLIFILLFALIELIPFLFAYRKKKELFTQIVRAENKNSIYYKQLIQSLSFEMWQTKRTSRISSIKSNYSKIYKNFNDAIIFKSNNELFKSLMKSLVEIALIAVCSYLIIKQNKLSIGKLTFIVATFGLYKNSISEIFNYFLVKIEFDVYWQVYKDLTCVSNLQDNNIEIKDVKSISLLANNIVYSINSANKVNELDKPFYEILSSSETIKLNDKTIDKNSKSLFNQIIVVDQYSNVNLDIFLKLLLNKPDLYSSYLRHFNIDINKKQIAFYDQIIINFLCLLETQNKVIVIDRLLTYVKPSDKLVVKDILNKIRKNNYLFITEEVKDD